MARLTRILFPLALLSLLISIASANYEANNDRSTQNPDVNYKYHHEDDQSQENLVDFDQLLHNLATGHESDHHDHSMPQGNYNGVPLEPNYDPNSKYQQYPRPQDNENFVPIEPNYPKPEKNGKFVPTEEHEDIVRNKPQSKNQESHEYPVEEEPEPEVDYIGIRGVILCKSGSEYTPIKRARARITCPNGFSFLSPETDENGYFLKEMSGTGLSRMSINIKACKAFLKHSPLKSCDAMTGKGVTGAPLSVCHTEPGKTFYTMGTLFYNSDNTHYSLSDTGSDSNNNGY